MGGRTVLRSQRGSATIELFLLIPMAALVVVAGIQVISIARARIELVGAVRDGARVAATTPDPSRAVETVQRSLPPDMGRRARVSVSRPSVVGAPARVSATVRHRLGPPFPGGLGVDISASASMLVER